MKLGAGFDRRTNRRPRLEGRADARVWLAHKHKASRSRKRERDEKIPSVFSRVRLQPHVCAVGRLDVSPRFVARCLVANCALVELPSNELGGLRGDRGTCHTRRNPRRCRGVVAGVGSADARSCVGRARQSATLDSSAARQEQDDPRDLRPLRLRVSYSAASRSPFAEELPHCLPLLARRPMLLRRSDARAYLHQQTPSFARFPPRPAALARHAPAHQHLAQLRLAGPE